MDYFTEMDINGLLALKKKEKIFFDLRELGPMLWERKVDWRERSLSIPVHPSNDGKASFL